MHGEIQIHKATRPKQTANGCHVCVHPNPCVVVGIAPAGSNYTFWTGRFTAAARLRGEMWFPEVSQWFVTTYP